jgi:hypothetical protein
LVSTIYLLRNSLFMKRYKKRDLGKIRSNPAYEKGKEGEETIDELVDADGTYIEGGEKNMSTNSEIHSNSTGDEKVQSAIQPNIFPIGSGSTRYSTGSTRSSVHGVSVLESAELGELVKKLLKEMRGDA